MTIEPLHLGQASIPAVNQYLQLAREQKLMINELLLTLGLSENVLSDNSQSISGDIFQQLIAGLIELSNDELFGFHTAAYVQPISYSVLGFITMNCETLGEAMSKIQPFEKLVGDMGVTTLEDNGEYVSISWKCQFTEQNVKRHMIDNCLASWLTFARYLTHDDNNPIQVRLTRQQPSLQQCIEYQKLFKCSVVFNQQQDAIIFDKSLLALPLNKGSKQMLSTLESHAQQQMMTLNNQQDIVSNTKAFIEQNLASAEMSQQTTADWLSVSYKTLQRRLNARGVNFKGLVNEIRLKKSAQLLDNTNLKVNEISEQLGFIEPRSFYRWFQNSTNMTPGQYRRR